MMILEHVTDLGMAQAFQLRVEGIWLVTLVEWSMLGIMLFILPASYVYIDV